MERFTVNLVGNGGPLLARFPDETAARVFAAQWVRHTDLTVQVLDSAQWRFGLSGEIATYSGRA